MEDSRRWGFCKGILFACVCTSIFTSVRASQLYPYGSDAGDNTINIGIHQPLSISTTIHFYGQEIRDYIYITKDGLVSPDSNVHFQTVNWRQGTPNLAIDLPFIAPFHYNGFVPSQPDRYSGKIYYRLVTRGQFSDTFLDELDSYLSNASVRIKAFHSDFAIVVTWENVTGTIYCSEPFTDCPSNTFQLAIVVGSNNTFAIFNYYKMMIPFNENQIAGINGGYGRGWTDVFPCVGSCLKGSKDRLSALARNRGSDVEGRYIHYMSDDIIVRGGCLSPITTASLSVYPREAGMFGGEMLSVSGECMSAGTPIYCRFGEDNRQISSGVMENSMRGRCPVPLLTTRGQVKVEVGRSRSSFQFFTYITIIYPDRLTPIVDTSDIVDDWFKMTVSRLTIRWPSEKFSTKSNATVSIKLIGYREDGKTNLIEWRPLVNLSSRTLNTDGQFSFNPSDFRCRSSCDAFEIGIVMVALDDEYVGTETQYQTFTMGPLALGWYVNTVMNETNGADWPSVKCREWDGKDKVDVSWLDRLLSCPCTLTQALADWGRWQPDVGCSMFSGSKCTYHTGAKHCVRSVNPSPDGSGNQCCYEQDGLLRYAADTFQGSTPDRSHDWGAVPYGKVGYVPSLSHWLQDVITFYYCCLWNEYRECKTYMDRRPTKDCRHYVPPQAATAYGDPHITTFDGTSYYFGGSGDFWLLKSDLINIQGQFQERRNEVVFINSTQIKPTVLTQVVMWSGESDAITITLAPPNGQPSRRLEVKVNGQRQFFEKPSLMWQDFHGVSVVNNAPTAVNPEDQAHSNFTILFRNGAGVQVVEKKGLLHLMVILPPINEQSVPTRGLLGTWDNNTSNDYTTSSNQTVNIHANEIEIYQAFALTWAVNESESLFQFPKATERQKLPLFGDPKNFTYKAGQTPPTQDTVNSHCGSSASCVRDFYVTNDANVAGASKYMNVTFATLKNSQKIVYSCGLLDIPMAQKSNHNYSVGSVVRVTGCRPQNSPVLSNGPVTYTCVQSHSNYPQWSPVPDPSLCGYGVETTTSTAQVTTSHGHHDITCTESRMEFSIPLSSPHTSETATLSDPNCQINLTRTHVRGGVDLNSCGTTVQFQNDSVIFRNAIIFSAPASSSLGSNGSEDSVSQYQDIIPIECVYNRIATVHLSYMPVVRRVLFTESGVGQFSFNIQQFWDASFTSVVSDRAYPLRLEQDADIFIQLSVGSEGQPVAGHKEIGMEVQQCLVSPSSSVIEAQLHYYPLIQDGCPASSDVHIIPNTNASDSTVMRFRFRAVNFFDPSSSSSSSLVFVHCRMGLCLTGSCKPSAWTCLTPPARRVRRDVDQSRRAAHQLSTGPFLIMADEASASSSSTTATVMAVVSTSVATVAIVVAAIALIALRRRRTTARN